MIKSLLHHRLTKYSSFFILTIMIVAYLYLFPSQSVVINVLSPINNRGSSTSNTSLTKVFCLIKSYLSNFRINKTQTIYNVWGRKCDDYRFIMLIPEFLRPPDWKLGKEYEIYKPFKILQPKNLKYETHSAVTDKIYHAFISIYKRFPEYPWYYLVDDDSYVNVNNLKEFLSDKDHSIPQTFGFDFKMAVKGGYHSGGPGYVISNKAFALLNTKLLTNYKSCKNSGIDDVDVNDCLRSVGTNIAKSIDDLGRQRFLVFSLMDHFDGSYPDWLYTYTKYPLQKGYACCSDKLIAVHYMSPREVVRLDIVIETQNNIVDLYKSYIDLDKRVTIKDIIINYISLEDFEEGPYNQRLRTFFNNT